MTEPTIETLEEQGREVLEKAKKAGLEQDFFFSTTLQRYMVQLRVLCELEKRIAEDDLLVTKEYVKGRKNLYANPAVKEYNSTADAANRTVTTLMNIITKLGGGPDPEDPVLARTNRG